MPIKNLQDLGHSITTTWEHLLFLLAIVNANYEILLADVRTNGRISDGGVIRNTKFYDLLNKNALKIPLPSQPPNSDMTAPYIFVGDEAFQLQENFMKPYSLSVLYTE